MGQKRRKVESEVSFESRNMQELEGVCFLNFLNFRTKQRIPYFFLPYFSFFFSFFLLIFQQNQKILDNSHRKECVRQRRTKLEDPFFPTKNNRAEANPDDQSPRTGIKGPSSSLPPSSPSSNKTPGTNPNFQHLQSARRILINHPPVLVRSKAQGEF